MSKANKTFQEILPLRITETEIDFYAKAQWTLIEKIANKYIGKYVPHSKTLFEKDIWFDTGPDDENNPIYWNTLINSYSLPLKLLLKIYVFETAGLQRIESSTFKGKIYQLKSTLIELIQQKRLIAGEIGTFNLSLSQISDEDLIFMLDSTLLAASSIDQFCQYCSEIHNFIKVTNHISTEIPFFEITAQLPWSKAGITITKWAEIRAVELEHEFPSGEGYLPLPAETSDPLIQKSLLIIKDYGTHLSEISPIVRRYVWGKDSNLEYANSLLQKYSPIFCDIVPPPDISDCSSGKAVSLVYKWLRKLVFLGRGACLNIILFTSGLRNKDIRYLKTDCCKSSGRVDILYYVYAAIKKTKNAVIVPVPNQTFLAIELLKKLKFTNSTHLFDANIFKGAAFNASFSQDYGRIAAPTLNVMLRKFAAHFNVPFESPTTGEPYSAHNFRTTVAGWLDSYSNLSVLLVRRLFGHNNNIMPTVYLRNNPTFIQERKEQKLRAAATNAHQMALAASQGKVAGAKGEQLINGYRNHISRLESDPQKSHSLTDTELVISFQRLIEERFLNESLCGFMTPFGVRCMRNPSDSSPPPCASRSHRDRSRQIAEDILNQINLIDPANCIGISCDQALMGPWSESLLTTILWNADLLKGKHGDNFTDEHFRSQAISFIRQYSSSIEKVFQIRVNTDGSVQTGEF